MRHLSLFPQVSRTRFYAKTTAVLVGFAILAGPATEHTKADDVGGKRGAVATVHPLATQAALNALEQGGNAIDAAVAAALTLGVVDNFNSGLGGGCFIVLRTSAGKLVAIDGRETAPALAHRDMFLVEGRANTTLSQTGPLAVGTPGALAAYSRAIQEYGSQSLEDLILPAAQIAADGFPLDEVYAGKIAAQADTIRQYQATAAILLTPEGNPRGAGTTLRQPDLAATYRNIAKHGEDWFYRELAETVSHWMEQNGGVLRAGDFAAYQAITRSPIVSEYRGHTIVGMPPPSSGGVHVAQILNILEHFDLKALHEHEPAVMMHVVSEAMKLAFADRAYWLGDPAFAQVPRGLISKEYAQQLANRIDLDRVIPVPSHSTPPETEPPFFSPGEKHTTHIATADAAGNWVAITATINTTFGSKVIVPGTGLVLNNEMDDFAAAPGVPNAFGLIGAEANAVAPGKRPLSSMSPTIVLKDGKPVLTVGAAGGPKIITQVVLAIIRTIDLGQPLDQTLQNPRYHHQWRPDLLMVERGLNPHSLSGLLARGHTVKQLESAGVTQAIVRTQSGHFSAAADPRVPGRAAEF